MWPLLSFRMTGLLTRLLLQSTPADLEIIYDVCWMLTPTQIQRMCTNYYVADYEVSIHFSAWRL